MLDGTRYVMRGYSTRGLKLSSTDDTAWQELRDQRAVLVMNDMELSLVERAGWAGIPVLWDARSKSLKPTKPDRAREQPAVVGIISTVAALSDPALQQAPMNCFGSFPQTKSRRSPNSRRANAGRAARRTKRVAEVIP